MKNNKGFTLIEGFLIVIIIGIIGGTGYYVWNSRQQTNKVLTSAQNETVAVKSSTVSPSKPQKSRNNLTQESYDPKFTYTQPDGWIVSRESSNLYEYIYLSSPDFKTTPPRDQECASFTGMRFTISSTNTDVDSAIVNKMLAPGYSATFEKDIKESTLGGQKAVEYFGSPGECGYSLTTLTVHNGYSVEISTQLASESAVTPYKSAYENLVASFKFL